MLHWSASDEDPIWTGELHPVITPENIDDRDRPLALGQNHKGLRDALGCGPAGAALALALTRGADCAWFSYSRRREWYANASARSSNSLMSYSNVTRAVDGLVRQGLAIEDRARPGQRGIQSRVCGTPALHQKVAEILGPTGRAQFIKPPVPAIVRDSDGRMLPIRMTQEFERLCRLLHTYNEALEPAPIEGCPTAPVRAIFNGDQQHGGRIFSMGPSWQNSKREARAAIRIYGEPVVEIDYKTLHPAILYSIVGAPLPEDCYEVKGWPRSLAKIALLVMINARTRKQAVGAIARSRPMAQIAQDLTSARRKAAEIVAALEALHQPIARFFGTGAGLRLMREDAAMAERVLMRMLRDHGIVVLPIHDSFLVPASKADQLTDAMLEAADRKSVVVKVERK